MKSVKFMARGLVTERIFSLVNIGKVRNAKVNGSHLDVVHFSKKIQKIQIGFSKNFEKILLHNLYFLTIVFGSKRPLLHYNMTIDYECKNISMKY
jgi:hypothetical protein